MRRFLSMLSALLAVCLALPAAAAEPRSAAWQGDTGLASYSLEHSAVFSVPGEAGDSYKVMVAWPEGSPPAAGWPALYMLDGEDSFAIAAVTARRLARAAQRSGVQPGIVVAISAGPLARRVRDYTPAVAGYSIPKGMPAGGLQTGGADIFLDMLSAQVMPELHKRWPIDPGRETLAGHSFGGLLALHALLTRPAMFDAAVAISPSLWFGNGLIGREAAQPAAKSISGRLLLAEGDVRGPGAEAAASPAALIDALKEAAPSLRARYLDLPGQSHGTTFLTALPAAIDFAFGTPK